MGKKCPEHGHGQLLSKWKCACCGCLELSQPAGGFCGTPTTGLPLVHTAPPAIPRVKEALCHFWATLHLSKSVPKEFLVSTGLQLHLQLSTQRSSFPSFTLHQFILIHQGKVGTDVENSASKKGGEDGCRERLMSSIQSCRQSSWRLLGW